MNVKRGMMAAGAAAAMACTTGAQLSIEMHDKNDPAPKRLEIGTNIAGYCVGLLLSWSKDAPRPTTRF
jgi:hypothetical protein